MAFSRRDLLRGKVTAVSPFTMQQNQKRAESTVPHTADPTLHLLQRITWGPRPDEVAHARTVGAEAFLEEQLNPEQIDDAAADGRLRNLPLLNMDRRMLHQLTNSEYRSYRALVGGMLTRAIYSKRQLLERMVEFWADHFNISGEAYTEEMIVYQREAIRANALGNFRDMLVATAKSPAMLTYLDNYLNVAGAPNENYAREVMELHTLGVDGGYTEQDVKEVARAFTGWTVHNGTRTGFYFNPAHHDDGPKQVLGHTLPSGRGLADGLHVLTILAEHPATARYLCTKLCIRFVSDVPPASLIDRLTAVWQQSDGAIKTVLRTLFLSDEFQNSVGQKYKRPLDFFIGALRATGTQMNDWWVLERLLQQLGQPPYGWHPPNGYPDGAGAWLNSGGLLARWNIAQQLSHGAYEDFYGDGYTFSTNLFERIGPLDTAVTPAEAAVQLVDAVSTQIFGAPLEKDAGATAHAEFVAYVLDGIDEETISPAHLVARKLATLYGLMLASPYFQWR